MIYRNTLRPSMRFAIVLFVLGIGGTVFWLGLLLDRDMAAFDVAGLVLLGLDIVFLILSVFFFARVRWARLTASVVLHVFGLAAVALGVAGVCQEDGVGIRMVAAGLGALAAGFSVAGILTLHGNDMREDMARVREPLEAAARRRKMKRVGLVLAGVVILGLGWIAWRVVPLLMAKPTITVDYLAEANRLSRPPDYDPNLDVAPHYERLFADFVSLPDELVGQERLWPTDLKREQLETLGQWVPSNEAALQALARAAQCPYWCYELTSDNGALCEATVPFLSEVRLCAYAFILLAEYRASQGDVQEAVDLLMDTHMMGVHRARGGTLLEQLTGGGICKICQDALLTVLARCDADADTLKGALGTLAAREPYVTIPRFAETERLYGYDAIQRAFSDDGQGNGQLIPGLLYETKKEGSFYSRQLTYLDALWICLCHPDRAETVEIYDRYWQAVSLLADQSPRCVSSRGSSYEEEIDEMLADAYYLHDGYRATVGCINIGWHNRAESRAVAAILAILVRRTETGSWPASLRDLVDDGYLQRVPMDPYADEALVYRAEGESFIVYSVGEDFFDDGGVGVTWDQSRSGGDRVFWPVDLGDERTVDENL